MGYRIDDLKKAAQVNGEDTIPLQQNGITKQVARSVMDQAVIVTASGAQNTGVVRKEGTYVLQNNSAEIRFTLQNAVGKAVSDAGDYVDSAAAAAGWIIKVLNNSTRNHTVISGANSWAIAAGEIQEYYWTGSAWTFHNVVTETKLNDALSEYVKTDVLSALPTDAVLHYSFDELPEVPDGTASYRHDKDWASTESWGGNATASVNNGILTITAGTSNSYVWTPITSISNSLVKVKAKLSVNTSNLSLYGNVNGVPNTQLLTVNVKANEEFYIFRAIAGSLTNIGFTNIPANSTLEIIAIYIGNGSYNSPVIDNSGNGYNGTPNGVVTTKGVSGKAINLNTTKFITNNDFSISDNFTLSLWVKAENTTGALTGNLVQKDAVIILRNGAVWGNFFMLYLYGESGTLLNGVNLGALLPANEWVLVTIVRDGDQFKYYKNGTLEKTFTCTGVIKRNSNRLIIGDPNNTRNHDLDDFQYFDRALSAAEVQALHNARANTPKYNFSNVITEFNKAVVGEITIAANGTYTNTNIDIEKRGYDVIMPIIAVTGNNAVYCYNQGYANGKMLIQLKNTSSAAVTITPLANIIYKKK